jgi:hypothetical protein
LPSRPNDIALSVVLASAHRLARSAASRASAMVRSMTTCLHVQLAGPMPRAIVSWPRPSSARLDASIGSGRLSAEGEIPFGSCLVLTRLGGRSVVADVFQKGAARNRVSTDTCFSGSIRDPDIGDVMNKNAWGHVEAPYFRSHWNDPIGPEQRHRIGFGQEVGFQFVNSLFARRNIDHA